MAHAEKLKIAEKMIERSTAAYFPWETAKNFPTEEEFLQKERDEFHDKFRILYEKMDKNDINWIIEYKKQRSEEMRDIIWKELKIKVEDKF